MSSRPLLTDKSLDALAALAIGTWSCSSTPGAGDIRRELVSTESGIHSIIPLSEPTEKPTPPQVSGDNRPNAAPCTRFTRESQGGQATKRLSPPRRPLRLFIQLAAESTPALRPPPDQLVSGRTEERRLDSRGSPLVSVLPLTSTLQYSPPNRPPPSHHQPLMVALSHSPATRLPFSGSP
ncbi:hypothetical protein IWZ00DRAFT_555698 [Phyllosticta capitalensis]